MIHYFRMLTFWLRSIFIYEKNLKKILDENSFFIRTMPTECNFFMIMDNCAYNKILDLSKFYILLHYRKFGLVIKRKWKPLTVSLDMSLIRPIKVLQKYRISSKVLYWENSYIYMEHKFFIKDKLHATALSKSCFMIGKKLVQDDDLNALYDMKSPSKPDVIAKWSELKNIKRMRHEQ